MISNSTLTDIYSNIRELDFLKLEAHCLASLACVNTPHNYLLKNDFTLSNGFKYNLFATNQIQRRLGLFIIKLLGIVII